MLAIILTAVTYSNDAALQAVVSTIIPILLLLVAGIPLNKYLPEYLTQNSLTEPIIFSSVRDAFEAMPYGLNKKLSKGIDTVIQFELTGKEATTGHLIIKNQRCVFEQGAHPDPVTTIKADSEIWLDIINNKMSGDKAFLNNLFEVKGDATILLLFSDLFLPPKLQDIAHYKPRKIDFNYKRFEGNTIQKIVVFDGGPRSKKYSKTSLMVNSFVEGAQSAGATVEYFKLHKYKIHNCTGCYTCWTKTPGECIFKDDMTELRRKYSVFTNNGAVKLPKPVITQVKKLLVTGELIKVICRGFHLQESPEHDLKNKPITFGKHWMEKEII
jgi:putative sterol carrier protein